MANFNSVVAWDKDSMATLNRIVGNLENKLSSLKRLRLQCHEQTPDVKKPVVDLNDILKEILMRDIT